MLIFYCINAVSIDGTWYDWKTIFSTVDGVKEAHQFTTMQSFMGEEAVICDDCGDTLIIIK